MSIASGIATHILRFNILPPLFSDDSKQGGRESKVVNYPNSLAAGLIFRLAKNRGYNLRNSCDVHPVAGGQRFGPWCPPCRTHPHGAPVYYCNAKSCEGVLSHAGGIIMLDFSCSRSVEDSLEAIESYYDYCYPSKHIPHPYHDQKLDFLEI